MKILNESFVPGILPPGHLQSALVRETQQILRMNLDAIVNSVIYGPQQGINLQQFQPMNNMLHQMVVLGNQPSVHAIDIMHFDMVCAFYLYFVA